MAKKQPVKKKLTKKATKKGATKKATKKVAKKKVAKKKVSKKIEKKATKKKVSAKIVKMTSEEKLEIKEQKALKVELDKEFKALKFKGTLHLGMDENGAILIKKDSKHECINDLMNDFLTAFEASLVAKSLAPVFQSSIFNDLKSKQMQ